MAFRSILVVDDDPAMRHLLSVILTDHGWEARAVASAAEALRELEARDLDLVLTDVRMPGMDGLEATRRIRASQAARGAPEAEGLRLPIVAVTAHAGKEDHEECLAAGMDDWLPKPFAFDQLVGRIERWVPWAFAAGAPEGSA